MNDVSHTRAEREREGTERERAQPCTASGEQLLVEEGSRKEGQCQRRLMSCSKISARTKTEQGEGERKTWKQGERERERV